MRGRGADESRGVGGVEDVDVTGKVFVQKWFKRIGKSRR
jgi:hypothetical protein